MRYYRIEDSTVCSTGTSVISACLACLVVTSRWSLEHKKTEEAEGSV